jgi:hypothetical protein
MSVVILSTLLLLWVVVDLLSFLSVPWQYVGDFDYLLLKESALWIMFTQHCPYFEAKWITRIVWHFSWLFSLLGIMIITKYGPKTAEKYPNAPISPENMNHTLENVKLPGVTLLTYVNTIQLVLLAIGAYAVKIIRESFVSARSGDLLWGNIIFFLIILPPFSILPQFFLSKIIARRSFHKLKLKRDYVYILLALIGLLLSLLFFARTISCL